MIQDTAILIIKCEWKTIPKFSNGTIFNDLELLLYQISRLRHYLTLNISETVRDRDIVTIGLIHALLKSVNSNDFE